VVIRLMELDWDRDDRLVQLDWDRDDRTCGTILGS
jgi:hypothetical protein